MVHEVCLTVIRLLASQPNPEKVVRLFTLVEYLNAEPFRIIHIFDNVLGNFGLLRICFGANPDINYARSILWIKWNLQFLKIRVSPFLDLFEQGYINPAFTFRMKQNEELSKEPSHLT